MEMLRAVWGLWQEDAKKPLPAYDAWKRPAFALRSRANEDPSPRGANRQAGLPARPAGFGLPGRWPSDLFKEAGF
ncbi:hypothetical protein JCM15519_25290 [Fundidesulfovibrio butyratiphilus]